MADAAGQWRYLSERINHTITEYNTSLNVTEATEDFVSEESNNRITFGSSPVEFFLDKYLIPSLCVVGFISNVINLIILSSSRYRINETVSDSGATQGLILLSLSDVLFCVVMFPRAFVLSTHSLFKSRSFLLYYQVFGTGFVTTFILTSTWITVTIAVLRYVAICHPLRSRLWKTSNWLMFCVPICLSIIFNLPTFWQYTIAAIEDNNATCYLVDIGWLEPSTARGWTYQWIKAVVGVFVPAILLIFCNLSLIFSLRRSYEMRKNCFARGATSRSRNLATPTLIIIVTAFIVLVFPSELMDFFLQCIHMDVTKTELFLTVRAIANTLQVLNFTCNIFLYCCINSQFRAVIWGFVRGDWVTRRSETPRNCRFTSKPECYSLQSRRIKTDNTAHELY